MTAFVFVIGLMIPSFGGPVTITVEATTLEGCLKARRAAWSQLEQAGVRYTMSGCETGR